MDKIVTLWIGGQSTHLFFGFPRRPFSAAPLHTHPYPEVHILLTGRGRYTVDDEGYCLAPGDVLLIPAACPHETDAAEGSEILAFQTDLAVSARRTLSLPPALAAELCEANSVEALSPVLHYLLARLLGEDGIEVCANDDAAYLINEYIEANYHRPLRLADLAAALHRSERQTQREIRRLTGGSFSALLRSHRMAVARRLAETTDMTAAEIAAYVGYETYSGFRRAFLKG